MNNENKGNKFRNNIDLQYLTNPTNLTKFKNFTDYDVSSNMNINIEKYKKFIISCTKKLLNREVISPEINSIFDTYIHHLINHFKFQNRNRIIQEQYKNIDNEKIIPKSLIIMSFVKKVVNLIHFAMKVHMKLYL